MESALNLDRASPSRAVILGLPLLAVSHEELPSYLTSLVGRRQPAHIALGTLPLSMACHRDVLTQAILAEAEAVLAGSSALIWAAKRLGTPLPARFTGAEILEHAARAASLNDWTLGLLCPDDDDMTAASAHLQAHHPNLRPPVVFISQTSDEEAQRTAIRSSQINILLVGLPPSIETDCIYRQLPWLGTPVIIGIGDGIAVTAGRVRSAPARFSRRGLGWLYELARHPWSRVPIYWVQLWFFVSKLRRQQTIPAAESTNPRPIITKHEDLIFHTWSGRITAAELNQLPLIEPSPDHSGIVLDLSTATVMDSSGLGHLLQAYRRTKASGLGFVLLGPPANIRHLLAATHLDRLLPIATTVEDAAARCREQTPRVSPSREPAKPGELILACQGDLTAPRLAMANRWLVSSWEKHSGSCDLTLDLAQVRLLDSSGIGWLLQARRLARDRNGAFCVINISGQPAQVIAQSNLRRVLNAS